ncbi:MAG: transcriptional regulator [Pseudomonadota bacterium]
MSIDNGLLLLVKSDHYGVDEADLGAKLVESFLRMLLSSGVLPAKVICQGSGVLLLTDGSPVLSLFEELAKAGSAIQACATCLDYYGRRNLLRAGEVGNMQDAVRALLSCTKVLQI